MAYKRILTIQDISCVGQCSMTVALPILSACGHETCILPTALLSTHTGGFGKPAIIHFDAAQLDGMWRHWQNQGITFDAILVGYLGSTEAVETAGAIMRQLLAPGGVAIVDPAMADHGRLYSGLDEAYAQAMGKLCMQADIMLPNLTEAAMLSRLPYREAVTQGDIGDILSGLNHPCVVMTGACCEEGMTGIAVWENREQWQYVHRKIGGGCHGTGDIFAAAFTGTLMQGKALKDAVKIAADYTCLCIERTKQNPAHWYGVKFEAVLPELMKMLE